MNEQDRLVGYLNGRDVDCPSCGYNLRGLKSSACPECDEHLTVRAIRYQKEDPKTPSFIVGAVGFVPAAVLLLVIWFDALNWPDFFKRGDPPRLEDLKLVMMILLPIDVVGGFWKWFDWAEEMTLRPAGFRWGWAAACWLGLPLALIAGRIMNRW
ncbi:MAG: hypothetical protein AB8F26_07815 [Phycisphaerales bacterium]